MKKYLLPLLFLLFTTTIYGQWQAIGPYGGIVRCFDTVGATVFTGTDGAGVLKSVNNGITWTGSSSGISNLQVYSLAHSGTTMIAGTYGGGVFKSVDSGATWTAISTGITNLAINAVAISGNTVLAGTSATNGGIFVSTNGGSSWTLSNTGLPANVYVLAITIDGSNIYLGTGDGVFVSTNNGSSWTALNTGLTDLYVNSIAANGSTLYAGTGSGVFKSLNGGTNWSLIHSSALVTSIILNGSAVYTSWGGSGAGGVDASQNNGSSWATVYNGVEVWSVARHSTMLYAGTNGDGVYSSSNNGSNWTQSSVGINNINTPAVLLATGSNVFAGAFLGGIFKSVNNGTTWTQNNTGLTNIAVQALATDGNRVYAGTSGTNGGVFSSINGGSSWTLTNTGITNNNVSSFAIDGTNLFAGTFGGGVFHSVNNGTSWTAVNTGLSNNSVQALAVNNTALYAGTFFGGVFKSTNNGGSWTAMNNGLTNLGVNALRADTNKLFAGTYGGVFVSADGGNSWVAKNTGLTDLDVISLAGTGAYVFAGTDGGGVFFSCDTGNSWMPINEGLFSNAIKSIAIADSVVFAATQGGAVFRRPLSEFMKAGVSIAIITGSNPACANESLTFTATPQCGGCPAAYQWQVDGINVGTDTSVYTTSSLTNGQIVTCVLTSNLQGIYNNPATSNAITISVVPAPPTPTIVQNETTLTSSATSGNQWYLDGVAISGATGQNYTINQNGNYTVIVTVGNCISDTSTVLTISSAFVAGVTIAQTGGSTPACAGQSLTFTATPANGGSTPSYMWLVNGMPVGTDSVAYITNILQNGDVVSCLLTSSMLGVSGNPATSNDILITVNPAPATPTVQQNGLVLTSNASSGNQWYLDGVLIPGATGQTYTATQNGNYTVVVTGGGCPSQHSTPVTISSFVSVSVQIVLTSGTNPTCTGQSLTFTATPVNGGSAPTYQWQVNGVDINGATNATYTTSTLTNGQAVTCIVASNLQGATNNPATSNAITIVVNTPAAPTISQNGLVLTSSIASGNQWYLNGTAISGATSQTYTVTQNGVYTVTAVVNGCTTALSAPATINNAFVVSVTIMASSGSNAICQGDTVTFTATPVNGGTSPGYQWKVNGVNVGSNSPSYTTSGLINNDIVTCILISSMSGVSGNPATSNAITMTVNPAPPVPVITQNGTLLTSSATSGLNHWQYNGSPLPDAFGQSYTASQNGTYSVIVTLNGCSSTSLPFDVQNIGITENELENIAYVIIHPNPTNGRIIITAEMKSEAAYTLDVRNALGQQVYVEKINAIGSVFVKELNIGAYGKGIYTININAGSSIITRKVIVY